ncbi:MAG TPA: molybdopterin molybdotransferase MoeA [Cytophagaceae bacterium]|nr:molybdopterin molybdotransferase MoeA [Cytophagaceae bacterium]
MITVEEAWKIIEAEKKDYGSEKIPFELALGRVLAEDIKADRDLPPYNRVAMDGIAISYEAFENGIRSYHIKATQGAGVEPVEITNSDECIEIMTGSAAPDTTDTIIRYEDLEIKDGIAKVLVPAIKKGQNIHFKGKDKKQDEVIAPAGQIISSALIGIAASVGKSELLVKKLPRIAIISSGDELVRVNEKPLPYQIRSSNDYVIKAALQQYSVQPALLHIPDDPEIAMQKIQECILYYDVILLSGGISMGKYDYIPQALEKLSVIKLFHKVKQKPGKPFWFGKHTSGALVFAFPGNPVSTFMCLHRYFLPWLKGSLGIPKAALFAMLDRDFIFTPELQYFILVKLCFNDHGQLIATPVEGNGSGDFVQAAEANAFMEFPHNEKYLFKDRLYRIWYFGQIFF